MPERTLLRLGAVAAIAGPVLAAASSTLLAPVYLRLTDPTDTEALLQGIAVSGIWVGSYMGLTAAALLVMWGLTALQRSITREPGAALARLGLWSALLGGSTALIHLALDGVARKGLAEAWAAVVGTADEAGALRMAEAVNLVDQGVFSIFIVVFLGTTFILYGLAVARSAIYPPWMGWPAAVTGVGMVVLGLNLAYNGPSFVASYVLFPLLKIVLGIWLAGIGALMWRRAGAG